MTGLKIPLVKLNKASSELPKLYSKAIIENEIKGIEIEHVVLPASYKLIDEAKEGYKSIYLFMQGNGSVIADDMNYKIVPESILLPNMVQKISIRAAQDTSLHYIKISSKLSAEDLNDLKEFPLENTQNVYFTKFSDCQSYTEPIKSPSTISRTILPNKIIPRIAMGTVQTVGPDEVGAHEHPMLEQLFLGLSKNNCVVYADDAKVNFKEFSLLHIPLGSRHSVSVEKDEVMYYVWMDFFLNKSGEAWLDTHIVDEN